MNNPETSILFLFSGSPTQEQLLKIGCDINDIGGAKNEEVYWLNTPGPIYTTHTDNCGTGQPEAPKNVGGDENYHEFVYKPPYNFTELSEIKTAAHCDPFGGYYFDGNDYWTNERIIKWWAKIESVIVYMINRYEEELQLPLNAHNSIYDFGKGPEESHFFGPTTPMPENYKHALDFYQYDLKNYLEWYMEINNGLTIELVELKFDWSRKDELDNKLKTFNPYRRNLIEEYEKVNHQHDKINENQSFWSRIKKTLKK